MSVTQDLTRIASDHVWNVDRKFPMNGGCIDEDERFVVEIDGNKHSEYAYFAEAIKTALLLRERSPGSKINVRDNSLKRDLVA